MSDSSEQKRQEGEPEPAESEAIARLLRLAGPRADAPPEVSRRVKAIVRDRWLQQVRARRRRRALIWSAASLAAALLLIAVGLSVRRGVAPAAPVEPAATVASCIGVLRGPGGAVLLQGTTVQAGASLETAGDARAALLLSSGAVLRLGTATRIALDGVSSVRLERGTIYLDTEGAARERGSVVVRTDLGVVHDVGTRFEVRVLSTELRVRVRQGSVSVEGRGETQDLLPGNELTMEESGAPSVRAVPLYGAEWDWILDVAPEFKLEGRTLGEFLGWVSSETGLKIGFAPDLIEGELLGIVLHGSIAGLRPDQAPGAVLPTCGLDYRVTGDTLMVAASRARGGAR